MSLQKVIFRADANATIGTGHVMRCLLLVEEFTALGIACEFIADSMPIFLVDHIAAAGATFKQLSQPNTQVFQFLNESTLLVVDNDDEEFYSSHFAHKVKQTQAKYFLIAFQFQEDFQADVLLNQNILALQYNYKSSTGCRFLLGPTYAILKTQFAQLAQQAKPKTDKPIVLITYGGTDQLKRTEHTLRALLELEHLVAKITVVVGGLYCCKPKIDELATRFSIAVEVLQNTPNMPEIMHQATCAFTSGGLTAWELGSLQTYNIVWSYTERERISGEYLMQQEMSYFLGHSKEVLQSDLTKQISEALKFKQQEKFVSNLFQAVNPSGKKQVIEACINLF